MTFSMCVPVSPAFSLLTASAGLHGLVCISPGSSTDAGVWVTGSSPQGKTAGVPGGVSRCGAFCGHLLRLLTDTSGHRELLRVKKLLLTYIAPASFGFNSQDFCWNHWGLRWALLRHWPLQLGAEEWAYIPCHQLGFRGSFAREAGSPVPWCPEGPQKYLPAKYLVPQGTKATGQADGPLKPAPLLYVCPREDAVRHGKAHRPELGETTFFILGKSAGNEISYLMQEPIKISHCITIYCLHATSIFHEVFKLEGWYWCCL